MSPMMIDLNLEEMMKFVKTIMAAALLTTALSTSVFAGGRADQANDTEDTLGYVGFTAGDALAKRAAVIKLDEAAGVVLFNTDAGVALNPALGTDNYTKGVKAFLVAVGRKSVADLRAAAPSVMDTDDKAVTAILKALKAKALEGKFSDKQLKADGTWIPAAEENFAKAIVAAANPISAEELGLLSAQKMALKTRGMVDATEVSIADLVADMAKGGADKAKALADAKKFKPLDAAKNGVSLADLIAKKKVERVATPEEKFGAELVKELQKAIAAGKFPLKIKGATDADKAKNAVASMIGMFDALGVMEAQLAGHGGGAPLPARQTAYLEAKIHEGQIKAYDIAAGTMTGMDDVDRPITDHFGDYPTA